MTETQTQFQVGNVYATRGGDRVRVDYVDKVGRSDPYRVAGEMISGADVGMRDRWTVEGKALDGQESPHDLLPGALPTPLPDPAQDDKAELLRWADRLLETLIEGDPDELAADSGITVLDVWREEAKRARAAIAKAERTS